MFMGVFIAILAPMIVQYIKALHLTVKKFIENYSPVCDDHWSLRSGVNFYGFRIRNREKKKIKEKNII